MLNSSKLFIRFVFVLAWLLIVPLAKATPVYQDLTYYYNVKTTYYDSYNQSNYVYSFDATTSVDCFKKSTGCSYNDVLYFSNESFTGPSGFYWDPNTNPEFLLL